MHVDVSCVRLPYPLVCLSQLSQLSMSPETDPKKQDLRKQFQQKIDEAGVVIFVLSKTYAKSKTCRMQVRSIMCYICHLVAAIVGVMPHNPKVMSSIPSVALDGRLMPKTLT
jgi:hypothetical protein